MFFNSWTTGFASRTGNQEISRIFDCIQLAAATFYFLDRLLLWQKSHSSLRASQTSMTPSSSSSSSSCWTGSLWGKTSVCGFKMIQNCSKWLTCVSFCWGASLEILQHDTWWEQQFGGCQIHDEPCVQLIQPHCQLWAGKPSGPGDVLTKYVFWVEYQKGWLGPPTLSSTNIHNDVACKTNLLRPNSFWEWWWATCEPSLHDGDGDLGVNLRPVYHTYICVSCWGLWCWFWLKSTEINAGLQCCVLSRLVVFATCEHTTTWEGGNKN